MFGHTDLHPDRGQVGDREHRKVFVDKLMLMDIMPNNHAELRRVNRNPVLDLTSPGDFV